MDRISGLSDDLLVKILSFLPTKDAVSTCILSKRWECLWMWLPKLNYSCRIASDSEIESLRCFLNRKLPLHRASVLESFRLDFSYSHFKPEDVRLWVLTAVSRCVRELDISYHSKSVQDILSSSLYDCKSLAVLELNGKILVDVPRMVSLPSLKKLYFQRVTGLDGESLQRLLSICPVLENLSVDFYDDESRGKIVVTVPSLQRLSLFLLCDINGLEINTPSLKHLYLKCFVDENDSCLIENMPKLEEACVDCNFHVLGSITSVKCLTVCLKVPYGNRFAFSQLEHLQLCHCQDSSPCLFARLLEDSPNLRVLDVLQMIDHETSDIFRWDQPSTVPTCFLSNLQILNWLEYLGRPEERDVVVYILQNARHLKTAKFSSDESFAPKLEILKELLLSSPASTTCQLLFD